MLRRALVPAIVLTLAAVTAAVATPTVRKQPPWVSVESPANPYDPTTRGAAFLVHALSSREHACHARASSERPKASSAESVRRFRFAWTRRRSPACSPSPSSGRRRARGCCASR